MSVKLSHKQRKRIIRENVVTHTYPELANLCGVTRRTIERDIERWRREGGYDAFLLEQFFKLYGIVKVKDVFKAFDRICDLLRRRQEQLPMLQTVIEEIKLKWASDESDTGDKVHPSQRAAELSQQ